MLNHLKRTLFRSETWCEIKDEKIGVLNSLEDVFATSLPNNNNNNSYLLNDAENFFAWRIRDVRANTLSALRGCAGVTLDSPGR